MKRIYCKLTLEKAKSLIRLAVDDLGWSIISEDNKTGIYELKAPADLLSFGNEVSVKVSTTAKRGKTITIESVSSAQFQLIDWGKNAKIEETFTTKIKELSKYEAVRKK